VKLPATMENEASATRAATVAADGQIPSKIQPEINVQAAPSGIWKAGIAEHDTADLGMEESSIAEAIAQSGLGSPRPLGSASSGSGIASASGLDDFGKSSGSSAFQSSGRRPADLDGSSSALFMGSLGRSKGTPLMSDSSRLQTPNAQVDLQATLGSEVEPSNLQEAQEVGRNPERALARKSSLLERMQRVGSGVRGRIAKEVMIEYDARLQQRLQEERARLYRAWPRTSSADTGSLRIAERLEKKGSLEYELELVEQHAMEMRNDALDRFDSARLMAYGHRARSLGLASDARIVDLPPILGSKELHQHLTGLETLSKRLRACRGEFKRIKSRLAGAFWEADRLRVELARLRGESATQSCDAKVLWQHHVRWLTRCQADLEQVGIRVPIPPSLLQPACGPMTLEQVLREELAVNAIGGSEKFERVVRKRLKRSREHFWGSALTEQRRSMLDTKLESFRLADALAVFHHITDKQGPLELTMTSGATEPAISQIRSLPNDLVSRMIAHLDVRSSQDALTVIANRQDDVEKVVEVLSDYQVQHYVSTKIRLKIRVEPTFAR